VNNNPELEGELSVDLMQKPGVEIAVQGTRVNFAFLSGTSLASETIPTLLGGSGFTLEQEDDPTSMFTGPGVVTELTELSHSDRAQPTVKKVCFGQPTAADAMFDPPHRCVNPTHEDYSSCEEFKRTKYEEKCSKNGTPYDLNAKLTYLPWQRVWLKGLVDLARSGKAQNVYIVCWTSGDFESLFENKFKGLVYAVAGGGIQEMWRCTQDTAAVTRVWCELSEADQTKRAFASDFDPAFALGCVAEASTILDWERRCLLRVAQAYPNVMVRYIDQHGRNPANRWDHKPQWFPDLTSDEQLAGGLPIDEVVWQSHRAVVVEQEQDEEIHTDLHEHTLGGEGCDYSKLETLSQGLYFKRQEREWSREEAACATLKLVRITAAQAREEEQAIQSIVKLRSDRDETMRKDFHQRRRENSAVSTEYDDRSESEYDLGEDEWNMKQKGKKAFRKHDPDQTGTIKTSQLRGVIVDTFPEEYSQFDETNFGTARCVEDGDDKKVCWCESCEGEDEMLTEHTTDAISKIDSAGSGEITLLEYVAWVLAEEMELAQLLQDGQDDFDF
jgi:hypothetical protein